MAPRLKSFKGRLPQLSREILSEFISTFILMILGLGSGAQMTLSNWTLGNYFTLNFSWGIALMLGIYWGGGVSGGHMNPAVTLGFAVANRLPWYKVPIYWATQLFSAFLGAVCIYGIYYDALNAFDGGVRQILGPNGTAGVFAPYPQPYVSIGTAFADQVVGTALLVGNIFAILDSNNNAPDKGVAPLMIGLLLIALGTTFGLNCGYPINPARDLGPRFFTAIAGWGFDVFTVRNHWAWVPVIAPLFGGALGALVYILFIEMHHPLREEEEPVISASYRTTYGTEDGEVRLPVEQKSKI